MSDPVHIAAIDAGSNAVRLSVVRAHSAVDLEPLHDERYPLRLGESVFVRHRFSEDVLKKGIKAFKYFREVMHEFGVTRYRAVATSATREAQNRNSFVRHIRQKAKLKLEVIAPHEESRLGREAVFAALGPESPLRCVSDLGGGSLEISILRDHSVMQSAQLPVGTVRLMTTLGITGAVSSAQADQVRKYLRALLESKLSPRPNLGGELAVALGGNAESLAELAPGPREHGLSTLELSLLRERLPDLLRRDVDSRMKVYGVRRDRADVMGIAGLIFLTLGRYLNLRTLAIPRVGLREALLREIAREAFSRKEPHRYDADSRQMLSGTRVFARRLDSDRHHAEHIRELSLQLFDQLQPVHHLPADARVLLELAALLHDVGHTVSNKGHHKHGEYLTLNGDIAGLDGRNRNVVAAAVRYHNRKADPSGNHPAYGALNNSDQRLARRLASILRIAEGLDHSHRRRVNGIQAKFQRGAVGLHIAARGDAAEDIRDANRSTDLFEHEFHVRLYFRPVGQ
ncbi:MAG: Ppx/GppA family phosphatase [Acidobacteria bacterium]|nr:Ppx/GppA family phosphatase [Acidobacteriota bacterium]MBS1867458.1 Ppx/GppA family phosphatase [Acidobacteriota bacterium]